MSEARREFSHLFSALLKRESKFAQTIMNSSRAFFEIGRDGRIHSCGITADGASDSAKDSTRSCRVGPCNSR